MNHTSQAAEPVDLAHKPSSSLPRRILVVDDDVVMRQFNVEILVHSGYQVDSAKDGAAAWAMLQDANYDLLVTDNDMPKVSGVELLKTLHAARRAVPVIMATGTSPDHEFARYPWIKPVAVILKPYTIEKFLGTVNEVLLATVSSPADATALPNQLPSGSAYGWETTMITYRGLKL